jgi:lactoylglutathione lyase
VPFFQKGIFAMQFRYSGFFVPDVPATVAFYETAFGFGLRYMHPTAEYAELETGATLLAFVQESFIEQVSLLGGLAFSPSRPGETAAPAQVAFLTDDLPADWARAVAAGATIVKLPETKPWGQTVGYLRDLNGFIVELCTRSPRDG